MATSGGCVYVMAPNTPSGNPRRGWLCGFEFFEEGYLGRQALPEEWRERADYCPSLRVSAGEYQRIVKTYPVMETSPR